MKESKHSVGITFTTKNIKGLEEYMAKRVAILLLNEMDLSDLTIVITNTKEEKK